MKHIENGAEGTANTTVTADKLAVNMKSGILAVFATPAMVALMEESACNCLADYLENSETTVGTEMNIKHISATPENMNVSAKAVLTEINNREFTFEVTAFDETGIIGKGIHKRFLVYSEKFTEKTYSKLNK